MCAGVDTATPTRNPASRRQPFTPTFTGELPAAADRGAIRVAACRRVSGPSMPDEEQYLKRWTFVLVVAAVWIVAAAIGLGLYYWWFHSINKTPAGFRRAGLPGRCAPSRP